MGDGGKGSAQRPIANRKTFEENWDAIFGSNTDGGGADSNHHAVGADVGNRPRDQAGQAGSAEPQSGERGS